MIEFVLIGIGGGVGAMLRYGVQLGAKGWASALPLGTLVANVLGCLLIGFLTPILTQIVARPELRPLLLIGLLGGFTTFSSFGFETFELLRGGQLGPAALYLVLSNALGLLAVWIGWRLAPAA